MDGQTVRRWRQGFDLVEHLFFQRDPLVTITPFWFFYLSLLRPDTLLSSWLRVLWSSQKNLFGNCGRFLVGKKSMWENVTQRRWAIVTLLGTNTSRLFLWKEPQGLASLCVWITSFLVWFQMDKKFCWFKAYQVVSCCLLTIQRSPKLAVLWKP